MFERYSEKARRSIFFARYEASTYGSAYIEAEHLLLGLLREDRALFVQLGIGSTESFRRSVDARLQPAKESISTSVDLPLSHECKRALTYAALDAEALGHKTIEAAHLLLGMLHDETSGAAELLRQNGIEYRTCRETVGKMPPGIAQMRSGASVTRVPQPQPEPEPLEPAAPSLRAPAIRLMDLVEEAQPHLEFFSDSDGDARLKRKDWTRKEAMGNLIDWATTYHQWIARALTEPKLAAAVYPQDEWVAAQQYRTTEWKDLVELWVRLNQLLLHVLAQIPEEKLAVGCRVGIEEATTLAKLIDRYVEHCADLVAQVLVRS
jgi:hypothetical protein